MVSPRQVPDEYDNPVPRLDYGPDAPRRFVRGLLQPRDSQDTAAPGRHAVTGHWWLLTRDPIRARERVEHDGRTYTVHGEPARWSPRPGHLHYETILTHTEG